MSTRRPPAERSTPRTADVEGYRRFLDYSAGVYVEGYEKLGAVPFLDFRSMLKAAPQLARYQAWRSVYSVVSGFVRNEKLRQALSYHTLRVGGNPLTTSAIYALIHKLERDGGVCFSRAHLCLVTDVRLSTPGRDRSSRRSGERSNQARPPQSAPLAMERRFDGSSNADVVLTYTFWDMPGPPGRRGTAPKPSRRASSSISRPSQGRTFPKSLLFGPRDTASRRNYRAHAPRRSCSTPPHRDRRPWRRPQFTFYACAGPHLGRAPIAGDGWAGLARQSCASRVAHAARLSVGSHPSFTSSREVRGVLNSTSVPPCLDRSAQAPGSGSQSRRQDPHPLFRRSGQSPRRRNPGGRRKRQGDGGAHG